MNAVIERIKRRNGMLILILDGLCHDLEAVQHRTLCSGVVLSCSSVLPYLREDLLDQDELIRHKWIVYNEIFRPTVAFDIQHGICKAEEVLYYVIVTLIQVPKDSCSFRLLGKESLLNDFIDS